VATADPAEIIVRMRGENSKAAERPVCWERRADRSVEAVEETHLNARPFVLQHAVDNRLAKGTVITFNVPPEDSATGAA
jgi:hypothetical protein